MNIWKDFQLSQKKLVTDPNAVDTVKIDTTKVELKIEVKPIIKNSDTIKTELKIGVKPVKK